MRKYYIYVMYIETKNHEKFLVKSYNSYLAKRKLKKFFRKEYPFRRNFFRENVVILKVEESCKN